MTETFTASNGYQVLPGRATTEVRDRLGAAVVLDSNEVTALRDYFAANPLPEPEPDVPWLDAAPGEVWVLTIDGSERLFRRSQHGLYSIEHGIPLDKWVPADSVTDGRRIWPVDAEGDGDE